MITKFDKNGGVPLYKREFIEAIEDEDFELALDRLLKYTEITGYPEFHLACGILYLQMTLDSDDPEFTVLAFREFMMHLTLYPDCADAYKNLLAVMFMRRDPIAIIEVGEIIKRRGFDLVQMMADLSDIGLTLFTDDESFLDFRSLFPPEAYGEIGRIGEAKADEDEEREKDEPKISRVIQFRGLDGAEPVKSKTNPKKSDKSEPKLQDKFDYADSDIDMLKQIADYSEYEGDASDTLTKKEISEIGGEFYDRYLLREAEHACDKRDFKKALAFIDEMGRSNERLYYCGECVRANILSELSDFVNAQAALDRAYAIVPDGALVGILQCRLYELQENYSRIPKVLKAIDIADFVDVDHAFGALMLAVKYCTAKDALQLAEEYADEFNSLDIRLIYAQLLYNAGEKEDAIEELRALVNLLYDDFNAQFFYLTARSGAKKLPVTTEAPQEILGIMIDNLISAVGSDIFKAEKDIVKNEAIRFSVEMFLTLEFDNTRSVIAAMFGALRTLAADERFDEIMRNALVSPYVEPLAKAVILSEQLKRGRRTFLTEAAFCPIHSDFLPALCGDAREGLCDAYALAVMFCRKKLDELNALAKKVYDAAGETPERDIANYLWRTVRAARGADKSTDARVCYALGYKTKAEANAAYAKLTATLDKKTTD